MLRTTSPHAANVVTRSGVDPVDERAQRLLVHEVELHALAGREAHRSVGQLGETVEGQPLLRRQLAARHSGADHAGIGERELLRGALASNIAVVLLVDAMELEEDFAAVSDERLGVRTQLGCKDAAEVVTVPLDPFNRAHRCRPHSVFAEPAHRPALASSPSVTGRVHGQQPIEA